jgi:tyrosine-protein phosphatase SIW14
MRLSRKLILYLSFVIVFGSGISYLIYSRNISLAKITYTYPLAEKIQLNAFQNMYKISDSVFRSEQPNEDGMRALEKFGIHAVLNLRNFHSDDDEAKGTGLKLFRVAMRAGKITDNDILQAMTVLKTAPKPILIHCLHGSDRTGCIVASYRILFQDWSKEEAIQELKNPAFGYHESWFPNIVDVLQKMDVPKMRKELAIK